MPNWFTRLRDWTTDDANNIGITSANHDQEDDNFAVGINASLNIAGQNSPTANIPFGGFKITGAADGTAASDYATVKQVQTRTVAYAADSVGTDAYAINPTPALTAYAVGQIFHFSPGTANTGAATLNISSLGAKTIKKDKDVDLATGDLVANQIAQVSYDGTNFQLLSFPRGLINQSGSVIYAADGGGSDSYAITLPTTPAAYTEGMTLYFKPNTSNTGAASLNVNSLGAKTIKKDKDVDLADNDIKAGQIVQVSYDGTNFQMLSPVYGQVGQSGAPLYAADVGASDTYAITLPTAPAAYAQGMVFHFKANTANTGAATLNVNSLGAVAIKKFGSTNDLATGDILAGQIVQVAYDGTNFQLLSCVDDINNLTADGSPDITADYVKTWGASASTYKKVLLQNVAPAASQSDQETGTSIITYVTPGRQQFHPSASKAWINFKHSGGTPTSSLSYNVSSLTDTATGRASINFTTAFSGTTYTCSGMGEGQTSSVSGMVEFDKAGTLTSSSFPMINNQVTVGNADIASFAGLTFFGDQ